MMRSFQNDGTMATPIEVIILKNKEMAILKVSHNKTIVDYANNHASYTDCIRRLKVWNKKVNMYNGEEFKLNWDSVVVIPKLM
jgi:uncharacterized spore protein YtfJ